MFAKADPAAYTEESIAASKSQQNGHATNRDATNGHDTTGTNGHDTDGHKNNRHAVNGRSDNGHSDGHSNGSSNGTVKELTKTSKSKGGKVHCHCKALALMVRVPEDTAFFQADVST